MNHVKHYWEVFGQHVEHILPSCKVCFCIFVWFQIELRRLPLKSPKLLRSGQLPCIYPSDSACRASHPASAHPNRPEERWMMAGQHDDLWMDTGHIYFNVACLYFEKDRGINLILGSWVVSTRCLFFSLSWPFSPVSRTSTQYSASPLYLQYLHK